MFEARIQQQDFDSRAEQRRLQALGPDIGAIVTFVGLVRDTPLVLEHYPRMAKIQMARLLEEARERWPLKGTVIIHRHGPLSAGEQIVLVATASSHRGPAFSAAEFLMDRLKTRAPFWKKEGARWVGERAADLQAAARWEHPVRGR